MAEGTAAFEQIHNYPWDDDAEFQNGLRSILSSVQDASQRESMTKRAKCYYFGRKTGTSVDFAAYTAWLESESFVHAEARAVNGEPDHGQPVNEINQAEGLGNAPTPASFAQICEMIAQGIPIPGIKEIPDTILEGQASASQAQRRKKPWEKEAPSGEAKPSWLT